MEKSFLNQRVIRFFYLAALFLIPVIFYAKTARFPFLNWDDDLYVTQNIFIRSFSLENIKAWFTQSYVSLYIPLTAASYALDYAAGGLNPAIYHISNLLLHFLNTLLIFAFFRLFFKSRFLCFAGALLFSLHPAQAETVAWISQRKTLLCVFFILAGFNLLLRLKNRAAGKSAAIAAWLAAFLCKVYAVAVIPLFVVCFYFYGRKKQPAVLIYTVTGLASVFIFFLIIHFYPAAFDFIRRAPAETISLGFLQSLGQYIQIVFWPFSLKTSYSGARNYFEITLGAAAGFIWLSAFAYTFIKKKNPGFWLGWTAAAMLPALNFFLVPSANHHLYLALSGIIGLILCIGERHFKAACAILIISLAVSCILLPGELKRWSSSETLWTRAAAETPENHLPAIQLADVYIHDGRTREATQVLENGIRQYPYKSLFYLNLGSLYLMNGNISDAQRILELAKKNIPHSPEADILRSGIALANRDWESAVQFADKAAARSSLPVIYQFRASAYLQLGKFSEAGENLLRLQRKGRLTDENRYQLSLAYLGMQDWKNAYITLSSMEKDGLKPAHFYFQMGYALVHSGNYKKAYGYYLRNIQFEPQYAPAYYHAGLIASREGRHTEAMHFFKQAAAIAPSNPDYKKASQTATAAEAA